nr:helix-turn-helix domain-containing protein [Lachnospiraceae bacterium]
MNNSKFSLVLRQCRENSGLTQKQVADALNVERSTYAYYETGTTHPSGSMIIKLSNIFNVNYNVFMDAVGDTEFDNNEEDENFTTLSDTSWKEREKIYTLPSSEQNLIINYRSLNRKQKAEIDEMINKFKEENKGSGKLK